MASKRNLRKKVCGRKKHYPSIRHAWKAINWLIRRHPGDASFLLMRAYPCPYRHGQFHIGHKPKRMMQAQMRSQGIPDGANWS